MMKESDYIIILCGVFKDSYTPLTRAAFWKLYHKYNDSLEKLIHSEENQVKELLKRSASVTFAIDDLLQKGIRITTFMDEDFPKRLLMKLGDFCPPLLYTCGNSELNKKRMVGYVGSRTIGEDDIEWTQERIAQNINDGYGVVTGGAKGIDSVAMNYALNSASFAVVYLPDNIASKVRDPFLQRNMLNNRLLLYSHISPYAAKTRNSFVASAMERNKYIYAQSVATVVVRSDLNKGGTWTGALETIKHNWSYVYAWDNNKYPGNKKLIELGAFALSDEGDTIKHINNNVENNMLKKNDVQAEKQLSIFDILG